MTKLSVLDDLERIKKIDKSKMLSFCIDASRHYREAARLAKTVSINYCKPRSVIVAGMGGSGIGGELLKDWARDRVTTPIEVCKEYSLPAYADEDTLVFVVSYSGETEESLSVFLDAVKRKCMVVCVSSGGALSKFAGKLDVPNLCVPSGMAPRATLPYLFMPLPIFLEKIGLASNVELEISETIKVLEKISCENSPEKLVSANFSKTLASDICGTIPVVYGFGTYRAVAQRLKTQFNENSKIPAKWECFPELDHNEIVGWEEVRKLADCFSIILVRDDTERIEIKQRIEVTKDLMRKEALRISEVWAKGKSSLAKMSSTICVGDFTSVYLAILRGIDPTPVKTIAVLKEKLKQTGAKEKIIGELERIA